MTEVIFKGNPIKGFAVKGHSTTNDCDLKGKIVCSAVSSAAYMAANTMIEIVKADVKAEVNEAEMIIDVLSKVDECRVVLEGFKLHIKELAKQYPQNIKIISEV